MGSRYNRRDSYYDPEIRMLKGVRKIKRKKKDNITQLIEGKKTKIRQLQKGIIKLEKGIADLKKSIARLKGKK